jgi:uncharacterized phage-like protein YoqJ
MADDTTQASNQNQITDAKYKVFHFNQAILGDYKASFAEYFMGLKDFILYAQGKNIGVSVEVNGNLEVKIFSDNESDLELVRDSIEDYILNLKNNGNEFTIRAGKTALDPQRALIYLQSKYFSLQTNLQLKNSELLQSQNANKFLESVYQSVISENSDLKKSNQLLLDDMNSAISKINVLKNELTKIKIQTLHDNLNKDPIENIINLLGSLSLVIDQKSDEGLVKKLINQLADYEKLNRDLFAKINLPEVNFKIGPVELKEDLSTISLSEIIQQITKLLYRKF